MGRPSEAKEKLLLVAFDLIWNSSYGSVCERASVNKGSFYHFFPSKADLAAEAYEEHWRERQPELDRIFSPQIPPVERLQLWCENIYDRQKKKAEKYGHVCGCPYATLGTEVATQDEKIRIKTEQFVDRTLKYVESALIDAKHHGLIFVEDPQETAKRVYSMVLGTLLFARIRNSLSVLDNLESSIMDIIGVRETAV
jgi:TetR/AcrR family transcriptional repressor of nem operon